MSVVFARLGENNIKERTSSVFYLCVRLIVCLFACFFACLFVVFSREFTISNDM